MIGTKQRARKALGLSALDLQPKDKILVLGGYGVRNIGDEAILAGLLALLPAGVRLRVVSRTPRETALLHQVDAVSPFGALWALLVSDVLIVGGGGLFSGHMGPFGKVIPLLTLFALALKKRVAYCGVGVYPSAPAWIRRMLRLVGPRLRWFAVRDAASAHLVRSWGVPVDEVPDLATHLRAASRKRGAEVLRSVGLEPGRPTVGLCLTATEPKLLDPILESIPALIAALPEAQFCFVPMSRHPKVRHHNDMVLARELQARSPRMAVLETWTHPSEVLALFGHFTAAVCMRYHSLLFAERAGVAIIPVAYAEKVESWAKENNQALAGLTAAELTERVRDALARGAA